MQVEHELRQRAFQAREAFLQYHKARTGQFRRQFEIHHAERFADLEMLLGLKSIVAFAAGLVTLDIAFLVRAVRHVGERRVGDLRKLHVEGRY